MWQKALTKKDFEEQNSMFLPDNARFYYLVDFPESGKTIINLEGKEEHIQIGEAIDLAMLSIEEQYDNLKGVLPKNFSVFSKDLLYELLHIFNKGVL